VKLAPFNSRGGPLEEKPMLDFIIYTVVFLAAYLMVEKIARRRWNISKASKSGLQGVNTIHTWVMRIGWTVIFISFVFFESSIVGAVILILLWGLDAFMQWKVNKAEREYMITLLGLVFFIIFITVGYTFNFLV
jgi:Domain of unknown function (DUF4181)